MAKIPKRTLNELAFYYKQAAPLGAIDFFVEGIDDKLLLDNYITSRHITSCPVYTMDTIDFAGVDFQALGLPAPSARSSVIALRKFLKDEGIDVEQHLFLVDRDTEDLCTTPLIEGIELTDSGALPVHLFDNNAERKFADLIYGKKIDRAVLKISVTSICTEIYLLRAAAKILGCGIRILAPNDLIEGNKVDGFNLNSREYIERCLYASQLIEHLEDVLTQVEVSRQVLMEKNPRKFSLINDHTLWDVLKEIGTRVGASNNRSSKDVEELVRMNFDADQLSGHRLFQTIEDRVFSQISKAA